MKDASIKWTAILDLYGFTKTVKLDSLPPCIALPIPHRFDDPEGQISLLKFRARNFDEETKIANYEYIE